MSERELNEISGGGFNASSINALARGIGTLYDLGKALGSAIRYALSGKKC